MRARRPAVEHFFGVLNIQGAKSAKEDAKNTKEMLGLLFFLRVFLRALRGFAVAFLNFTSARLRTAV